MDFYGSFRVMGLGGGGGVEDVGGGTFLGL